MKKALHPIHCVLENNPARTASPLPADAGPLPVPAADWEPLLQQYHKGDKRFFQLLCCRSKPLVEKVSRKPYFANTLGRDEAYSIAAMTMVEFWHGEALTGDGKDLPRRLTRAMNCDLINQIRRQNRNIASRYKKNEKLYLKELGEILDRYETMGKKH